MTVTVTVNSQSGSLASGFTYVVPPTVTGESPNSQFDDGWDGSKITGTNTRMGATVTFGSGGGDDQCGGREQHINYGHAQ